MYLEHKEFSLERAIRKTTCRKCKRVIKKRQRRARVDVSTRFGMQKWYYHPMCLSDILSDEIKEINEKVKLLIKASGLFYQ